MTSKAAPRILVTGCSGFVWPWLRLALTQANPNLDIIETDWGIVQSNQRLHMAVDNAEQVDATIRRVKPTCIIHLAAISSTNEARVNPQQAIAVNVQGTANLALSTLRHVPSARFIFVGTGEVYGKIFLKVSTPVPESAPLDPLTTYAATKAAADILVGQIAQDGLEVVRLRPFNHTGPGQTDRFVIPALAKQVAAIEKGLQEPILKVGNLAARRDFLDVRDVVSAYARVALHPHIFDRGLVMNVASGIPRSIAQALEYFVAQCKIQIQVEVDPTRYVPNDIPESSGNAALLRELLGWYPKISWEHSLQDVLDYWRQKLTTS